MKKTLTKIIGTLLLTLALASTSFAGSVAIGEECKSSDDCKTGLVCSSNKICQSATDVLLPIPDETIEDYPEVEAVRNLPRITIEGALATVVKTLLGWSMIFALGAIIVSALYYLISRGKEEDTAKAKQIILYLVIGIAIMAAAYGVVTGLTQFDFFKVK